jgi:hypothetical protein
MNICSVLSLFILGLFLDPSVRPPLPFGFSPAGDDCAEEGVSPAGVVGVAAALGVAVVLVGDGDGGGVTLSGRIGDVSGVVCEAGSGLAGFDLKIIN